MIVYTDEAFINTVKTRNAQSIATDLRAGRYLEAMWHSTLPKQLILERVP